MSGFVLLPLQSMISREVVRFFRQKSRVIGALGTPLLFWFVLGSGMGKSFSAPYAHAMNYKEYFFPGTLLMLLLFSSIFSNISLIQDKNEGFLQGVMVAPVPRMVLVTGKILGGTVLSLLQGMLFLLLIPLQGFSPSLLGLGQVLLGMFLIALGLTSMGFYFAWKIDSIQGFHGVMNLLLFPMWMLSGSLFPVESAPGWLSTVMRVNPLTYGLSILRAGIFDLTVPVSSFLIVALFGAFFVLLSAYSMKGKRT